VMRILSSSLAASKSVLPMVFIFKNDVWFTLTKGLLSVHLDTPLPNFHLGDSHFPGDQPLGIVPGYKGLCLCDRPFGN
jgi:hypothetical protein